jgi:carbon storage regulator CsrA
MIDGGRIVVTIVAVRADGLVKVGIDAPIEVSVHREEIHLQILAERRAGYGPHQGT